MISRVFDASTPPQTAPPGFAGVLGYVGKRGFTPHVWTPEEWRRFGHLRQFPCYVPDLNADPAAEARIAVAAVEALGWAKFPEPNTRAIICDTEVKIVPAWYATFAAIVGEAGFIAVDYGSLWFAAQNLAADIWAAEWDGNAQLEAGQTIHGHQYNAGQIMDLSVIDEWLLNRGGVGPRRA
jgi:hypothetical protein